MGRRRIAGIEAFMGKRPSGSVLKQSKFSFSGRQMNSKGFDNAGKTQ